MAQEGEALSLLDGEYFFALYSDSAFAGDQSWHIFKFQSDIDVKNLQIPRIYRQNHNEWLEKQITWSYSEGGYHLQNAHIEIIGDTYLIFVRGELYHSLYDIETNKMLIEDHSPWHTWIESDEYKEISFNASHEEKKKSIEKWKRKILHNPIAQLIVLH